MDQRYFVEVICKEYDEIVKKIAEGRLYGMPLGEAGMKTMVVAAYYLGKQEAAQHALDVVNRHAEVLGIV